ncbi:MAG: cation-translocating P-type ATPase [Firmicutes bacterium]|nr:cation-translocating P-type ATPase [Bacillota bacterium]
MALLVCDLCEQPIVRPVPADGHTFCCHGCRDLWRVLGPEQVALLRSRPGIEWSALTSQTAAPVAETGHIEMTALALDGVWCASCGVLIEHVVRRLPGVLAMRVDAARSTAEVTFDAGKQTTDVICEAITDLGYKASANRAPADDRDAVDAPLWRRLAWSAILAIIVMMLSIPVWFGYLPAFPEPLRILLTSALWVLSTPVLLWGGWPFLRGAWTSIRHRVPTMDLLVSTGAVAAYSYGVYGALTAGRYVYFDTSDMLVVFLLLGRSLEAITRNQTSKLIRMLVEVTVKDAWRITDEQAQLVPVTDLIPGDQVEVRSGQRVPVDGVVLSGVSTVDESILTGESQPVVKRPDASVYAGTINHEGRLRIRVSRPSSESVLAQTASFVQSAQLGSARLRAIVDRALHWFVPAVLSIGVLTFLLALIVRHRPPLDAMLHAVSVFVIACPCALSVATPLALSAASRRLGRIGILIRGQTALEQLPRVDTVVFDKTGTLTEGRMQLISMTPDDPRLLALAAAADYPSEHPVAQALVAAAESRGLALDPAESFTSVTGWGVRATIRGMLVEVGMAESGPPGEVTEMDEDRAGVNAGHGDVRARFSDGLDTESTIGLIARHETGQSDDRSTPQSGPPGDQSASQTQAVLRVDGITRASFVLRDRIRHESAGALEQLRDLGLTLLMATGDGAASARPVASALGLTTWRDRQSPVAKAEWIRELQQQGHHVLFVGDGVNDAPALAQADIGLAVGLRADIAAQAGDLLQILPRLDTISEMLAIGRLTTRVILQNLVWAIAYNAIALCIAVIGATTPLLAALAMVVSSLFVLTNSLRIVDRGASRSTLRVASAALWTGLIVAIAWSGI